MGWQWFYLVYAQRALPSAGNPHSPTRCLEDFKTKADENSIQCLENSGTEPASSVFSLSWSHYMVLMRIKDAAATKDYQKLAAPP